MLYSESLKEEQEVQSEIFQIAARVSAPRFLAAAVVSQFDKTFLLTNEIFSLTNETLSTVKKILLTVKDVFFVTTKTLFGAKKILFAANKVSFAGKKVLFVTGNGSSILNRTKISRNPNASVLG